MSSVVHMGRAPAPFDVVAERAAVRLERRCRGCGYGAVTTRVLLRCPMCGGDEWREGVNGYTDLLRR